MNLFKTQSLIENNVRLSRNTVGATGNSLATKTNEWAVEDSNRGELTSYDIQVILGFQSQGTVGPRKVLTVCMHRLQSEPDGVDVGISGEKFCYHLQNTIHCHEKNLPIVFYFFLNYSTCNTLIFRIISLLNIEKLSD